MKHLVCIDTTLRFLDVCKPITSEADASWKDLGATLLQDGHPVAFASVALIPTGQCYVKIEHEIPASIFGVEQFHTYIFGHTFAVKSDHKPLRQIKLEDASVILHRMLLCLWNYDFIINYHHGREMLVVNALSCYAPPYALEICHEIVINHVHITPQKRTEFQTAITNDPLHSFTDTILAGLLEDINDVPHPHHQNHENCDVLTVEDGLILYGEALVLTPREREKVLQAIHKGHLGITKWQYCAGQCVYWPGINVDIKCTVKTYATCQHCNPQEP